MHLVKMENPGDCGPACLAMVLDKTLDQVAVDFPDRHVGVTADQMIAYLAAHGVPAMSSLTWPSSQIPAILTVPSLNHPGLLHYVVWDGKQLLDPSNEARRYPDDLPSFGFPPAVGAFWATVLLLWLPQPTNGGTP